MKKVFAGFLSLLLVGMLLPAIAGDLGVQVIGKETEGLQPATLDDVQLEVAVQIDGYAEIKPIFWSVQDCFLQRQPDKLGVIHVYEDDGYGHRKIVCDLHHNEKSIAFIIRKNLYTTPPRRRQSSPSCSWM